MVQNLRGDLDFRRNVVTRSSPTNMKISARNIIHGYLDEHLESNTWRCPGTLVVFEFEFPFLTGDRRIRRAEISVSFAASQNSSPVPDPEVLELTPHGEYVLRLDVNNRGQFKLETTMKRENEIAMSGTPRYGSQSGYTEGVFNALVWQINESMQTKAGIPGLIRTAVLLRRHSEDAKFEMKMGVKLTMAGLSFQPMAGRGLLGNEVVIVDPTIQTKTLDGVDSQNLGKVDLNKLFKAVAIAQDLNEIRDDPEQQRQRFIRSAFGALSGKEPNIQKARMNKAHSPSPIKKFKPGEYFYAELWSHGSIPETTTKRGGVASGSSGFEALDDSVLYKYFPWVHEEINLPSTDLNPSTPAEPEQKKICSLIARQRDSPGCQSLQDLNELFSEETLLSLMEFFNLPTEFSSFRQHDRGIWLREISNQGQDFAYLYQTPFYAENFWSLVLVTRENSTTGAGILQSDSKLDVQNLLQRAQQYGSKGSHPLVILVLLFEDHVLETSKRFNEVSTNIQKIDADLLAELKAAEDHKTKLHVSQYGTLSHQIYQARMDLVELQRRREFEAQLGKTLQNDLKDELALTTLVDMFTGLSASHELNVQSLPDRIEGQRTVLYSLIAQQDARVQFKLARETTKDSKAMKTLAVITILLLPGTFMATLFAVPDLISFSPGAKSKIYWGVTVPATFATIVGWWLWVRRSSSRIPGEDEESRNEKIE